MGSLPMAYALAPLPGTDVAPPPILLPEPLLAPASRLAGTRRDRLFPVAPGLFRWLERRFLPGRATRLEGPTPLVAGVTSFLIAAVAATGGTVSLRDGANRFAPYTLAALGRRWEVPADELLDRVRLARAFTAHQMVTLLETWADDEVAEPVPADLLVAGDPATLLEQEEVLDYERAALLPYVAGRLGRLAATLHRPLLLVRYGAPEPFDWGAHGLALHETLTLAPTGRGATVTAARDGARIELVALAPHQRHLEEYEGDPAAPGGIERWDGPFPRTATP